MLLDATDIAQTSMIPTGGTSGCALFWQRDVISNMVTADSAYGLGLPNIYIEATPNPFSGCGL
jgi:hypothetical protein